MMRSCPNCGQLGQGLPSCQMCGWHPEPPQAETALLVGDQVITMRWSAPAGVPIGEPVKTQWLWDWLRQQSAR